MDQPAREGPAIATAPSPATFVLLRRLGVPKVNFDDFGFSRSSQILLLVAVAAALVSLLGGGLEWGFRRLFPAHPRGEIPLPAVSLLRRPHFSP